MPAETPSCLPDGRESGSSAHTSAADSKLWFDHQDRTDRLDDQLLELSNMMPKSDTIAAILEFNPTADPVFLAGFPNDELDEYLHRLRRLPDPPFVGLETPVQPAPLVAAVAPQNA